MSTGRTGNESILLCHTIHSSIQAPDPCLECSAQTELQGKLFPKPSWLQHLDFPFKSSRFPPELLNLEILFNGASQAAASSNVSSLGMGFPSMPWASTSHWESGKSSNAQARALGLVWGWLFAAGGISARSICRKQTPWRQSREGRETTSKWRMKSCTLLPCSNSPNPTLEEGATPSLAGLKSCDVAKSVTKQNVS